MKYVSEFRDAGLARAVAAEIAAVAAFLSVDKATVYRLATAAELPAIEVAPRVLRFRPSDVRDFLERRTRKAPPRGRVKALLGEAR